MIILKMLIPSQIFVTDRCLHNTGNWFVEYEVMRHFSIGSYSWKIIEWL